MPILSRQPSSNARPSPSTNNDLRGGPAAGRGTPAPTTGRRTPSAPWSRLKPAPRDELLAYGLPSRGETRLNNPKAQEKYYEAIFQRYHAFCHASRGTLEASLQQLAPYAPDPPRPGAYASTTALASTASHPAATTMTTEGAISSPQTQQAVGGGDPELELIYMAMRKLRESLTATRRADDFARDATLFVARASILARRPDTYVPALTQLLTVISPPRAPPAARPPPPPPSSPCTCPSSESVGSGSGWSAGYLSGSSGSASSTSSSGYASVNGSGAPGELTAADRRAAVHYLLLDAACRRGDLHAAASFVASVRARQRAAAAAAASPPSSDSSSSDSPRSSPSGSNCGVCGGVFGHRSSTGSNASSSAGAGAAAAAAAPRVWPDEALVAAALSALLADAHWPGWWLARARVEGHARALMSWADWRVRARALGCVARAYLTVDAAHVLRAASGGAWDWEELCRREKVGWTLAEPREGDGGVRMVVVRKSKRAASSAATTTAAAVVKA